MYQEQQSIIRGADDQAAAYEALLTQWQDIDPEEEEREWQRLRDALQETRRELQQRPLFTYVVGASLYVRLVST
jgi:hypothetical protein